MRKSKVECISHFQLIPRHLRSTMLLFLVLTRTTSSRLLSVLVFAYILTTTEDITVAQRLHSALIAVIQVSERVHVEPVCNASAAFS